MLLTRIILAATLAAALPAAAQSGKVIMTTSDYVSGNTASFDIGSSDFADNLLGHYQDATVRSYGRRVFILEGGDNSNIIFLDSNSLGKPLRQFSVGAGSNPHDLVMVPTAGFLKGYVLRFNKPAIWVVNLDAGKEADFKLKEIDISAWKDADGSPEAHIGWYSGGFVYVALQRYDLTTYAAGTAELLKIDPVTDTVVDVDPSQAGIQGITLLKKNPSAGSLLGNILYLSGTSYGASDEGVWTVDLADPGYAQKVVLSEKTLGGNAAGVYVPLPDFGVVSVYNSSFEAIPRPFDPRTGEFLTPLSAPDAGGGMVLAGGFLYIGVQSKSNPGLAIIRPGDNKTVVRFFPTSLPPLAITFAGDDGVTSVEENTPSAFELEPVSPNPFNAAATVSFTLARNSRVTAAVYAISGQKVATLADGHLGAGKHSLVWRANGCSSGVYFVRISDGVRTGTVKAVFLK